MISVLIVDDHKIVRDGMQFLLEHEPGVEVVGQCADGKEALEAVEALVPHVVLLDLMMPGMDGLAALRRIKAQSPSTQVVVLTSSTAEEPMFEAIKAGATSYLLKTAGAREVIDAVRAAARGESLLEPSVATLVLQELRGGPREHAPGSNLTAREMDVLTLVARGRSNRAIAAELYIGEETVKTHISNILAKLHLEDRTQAAIYALRQGIVPFTSET
ncbi:MAG TPA: response regulator transcription factor [Acidimicrobiales bacterium]